MPDTDRPCRVGLFVTCLVDLYRPSVGFAAVALLQQAGCQVDVPSGQTCCGQPAYNAGARAEAADIVRGIIDRFAAVDHVVVPSGSCAAMIVHHWPTLFADATPDQDAARALSRKTWELTSFLVEVRGMTAADIAVSWPGTAVYHDGCSGLRELSVRDQPRRLLSGVKDLVVVDLPSADVCCGFGGTFCVKYPGISNRMVEDKMADIGATGADMVLAGDMGCLLNIAGKSRRQIRPVAVRHVAEVLAGHDSIPAIGDPNP